MTVTKAAPSLRLVPPPSAAPDPTPAKRSRTYSPTGALGRRLQDAQALQIQIQDLEAKLLEHRQFFLAHMEKNKLTRLDLGRFVVTRKTRHNWTYTPETEREQLRLRQTQKWEQSTGVAVDNPTIYLAMSTNA